MPASLASGRGGLNVLLRLCWLELRYQWRRPLTRLTFAGLLGYPALMVARAAGLLGEPFDLLGDGGAARLNSARVVHLLVTLPCDFAVLAAAALMASAASREVRLRSQTFVATTPVPEPVFLSGRFLGALLALLGVLAAPALGVLAVTHWPSFPPERLGPFRPAAFLAPYVALVWPNALALGAVLFSLAATTRREASAYLGCAILLAGLVVGRAFSADVGTLAAAAVLDPFGRVASEALLDRLLTPGNRETLTIPLQGPLLLNRLLWLTVGLGALTLTMARFRFSVAARPRPDSRPEPHALEIAVPAPVRRESPSVRLGALRTVASLAGFELRSLFRGPAFRLALLGLLVVGVVLSRTIGIHDGTPSHPVTFLVLEDLASSLMPLAMLLTAFFTGEMVWRERDTLTQELCDTKPAATAVRASSKLLASAGLALALLLVIGGCGALAQLAAAHWKLEPRLYLTELLLIRWPTYVLFAILTVFVHVAVNRKYVGHLLTAALYAFFTLNALGLPHPLLRYGADAGHAYSDFDGYGSFVRGYVLLKAYWAWAGLLLALGAFVLWPRGADASLRNRLRAAGRRAGRRVVIVAAAAAAVFAGLGAWIARDTLWVNPGPARADREAAAYEKLYRRFAEEPQPSLTSVSLQVELFPRERRFRVDGRYRLRNQTKQAIDAIHVSRAPWPARLAFYADRPWREAHRDDRLGYYVFALASPLLPGEQMGLRFELDAGARGIRYPEPAEGVLANGTLLMSGDWAPWIGYLPAREVVNPLRRRSLGLGPRPGLPPAEDPLVTTTGSRAGERVAFEVVVGTDADQLAVAPGRLQREWSQPGRRYLAYASERAIWNHYAITSARYAVRRARWRDVDLEVYFHPQHAYNVDHMLRALREALAYHEERFAPYQYSYARVVEVPRHVRFAARAYPGLVLCSETGGFLSVADPADGDQIDVVSSRIAHEVAHQWWGHQAAGAPVKGGPFLQETLAQYSRLAVLRRLQGDRAASRLLEYARDRYFSGRAAAVRPESPLAGVTEEPYVFYEKGLLAMHGLASRLGEDRLTRGLATYLRDVASREPPYGTSSDLLSRLREVTPAAQQGLLSDLLESVTLYDLRLLAARSQSLGQDRFRLVVRVAASKSKLDERGAEHELPLGDPIELAVFGSGDRCLFCRELRMAGPLADLTIDVGGRPERVVLDPGATLLERNRDDNEVAVQRLTDGA